MKVMPKQSAEQEARGMQIMQHHFLSKLMEADSLSEATNLISGRLQDKDDPLRKIMSSTEHGLDALSCATFFLGASVNSLIALRLLTVGEITKVEGHLNMEAHITVNGTAGLIRQVVECAARALWLMTPKDLEEMNLRGFAGVWANAEEAVLYAVAVGSPQLEEKEKFMSELLQVGKNKNWMNEGSKKPKPTFALSGATDILKKVTFDTGPLKPAESLLGSKADNGEWVYRWLSGMAHGYVWVQPIERTEARTDEMDLVWTKPDWTRLTLSVSLAVQLVHLVIEALNNESPFTGIKS